jgi:diguanylate cyclase (GGDEF)-like protein
MTPAEAAQSWRVVLVGRTDLDAALRHDSAVQLARVRTPIDAVGEFAEMYDPDQPCPSAIVVGPGVLAAGEAADFAHAMRIIDPEVRLIGMGPQDGAAGAYDATLPARADAASLRRLLLLDAESAASIPQRAPVQNGSPQPASSRPSAPVVDTTNAAVAAMLTGRDPIAAAVADLIARTGGQASFVTGEVAPTGASSAARVHHGGKTLGWLCTAGIDSRIAEAEAGRLAGWVMLAAQHDQLRRAAFTDELTGAFNRRYFNRFLSAAMDQARARRHTVTLLVFDIDNFKTYNDKYSHAAGDEILRETVHLLTSVIRPSDRVCRVGGDEFAVVFHDPEGPRNPDAPQKPQSIAQIAARFQKQICEHRFPKLLSEAPGTLTISGGMATFPWDGATPDELLEQADLLALQSKRQGKNAITFGPGAQQVCGIGE